MLLLFIDLAFFTLKSLFTCFLLFGYLLKCHTVLSFWTHRAWRVSTAFLRTTSPFYLKRQDIFTNTSMPWCSEKPKSYSAFPYIHKFWSSHEWHRPQKLIGHTCRYWGFMTSGTSLETEWNTWRIGSSIVIFWETTSSILWAKLAYLWWTSSECWFKPKIRSDWAC